MRFLTCPRCDGRSYERLKTHAYCAACDYSPEFLPRNNEPQVPPWVLKALKAAAQTFNRAAGDGLNYQPQLAGVA